MPAEPLGNGEAEQSGLIESRDVFRSNAAVLFGAGGIAPE